MSRACVEIAGARVLVDGKLDDAAAAAIGELIRAAADRFARERGPAAPVPPTAPRATPGLPGRPAP